MLQLSHHLLFMQCRPLLPFVVAKPPSLAWAAAYSHQRHLVLGLHREARPSTLLCCPGPDPPSNKSLLPTSQEEAKSITKCARRKLFYPGHHAPGLEEPPPLWSHLWSSMK
ncbi:hypothetical protein AOQ84DRAFT_85322 [Glonium stellatum]|uniref:Uncharacterized protein n=1 Tax=Glonium stellatum TaxID=574774 RepID=A0A8E2FBW3_9PEZI|nr:hypothetical protein AOQ84DRAFT_85322 [Glonium stellatum]